MTRVIPLHTYQSPNGQGLCTYETEGTVCGNVETYVVHVRTGCGVEAKFKPVKPVKPVTDATLTPLVPGQGMPKDPVREYLDQKASMAYQTYHGAAFPVDDPPTTAQVVAMFHDTALRLAVSKDQTYRKAWQRQGYMGNVSRVLSKVERLRAMVWGDGAMPDDSVEAEESVRDTLLDLANMCAFAAHNLAQNNRWGDDRG